VPDAATIPQTYTGTPGSAGGCGGGYYVGVHATSHSDPYVPGGEEDCYWELTSDCGESNNSGCQCASRTCEWTWEVSEEECHQCSCTVAEEVWGTPGVDPAPIINNEINVQTFTGTCGGGGECQCDGSCEWVWTPCYGRPNCTYGTWALDSTCYPIITPATWTQTSDCGCDNCDCPEPSGQGSPIPGGPVVTMTTHCSGTGTSGGAGPTVDCDCDIPIAVLGSCGTGTCEYTHTTDPDTAVVTYILDSDDCEPGCGCPDAADVYDTSAPCQDSNATGYEDGETATTPCYGGDCDTSNASCCGSGDCMYTWSGGAWNVDTDTCSAACEDPDVLCECHEPTYPGGVDNEAGNGTCMPVATTAALSNRTFGLVNKIPQIRNSREGIRDSSVVKVTRKGVSKVYLNVKAIKRKRQAMARNVAGRRQRMR